MPQHQEELKRLIEQGGSLFLPHLSVDVVIFGYEAGELKVLLLEMSDDRWMLPGGYIYKEESVDAAAKRLLLERTGLEQMHLKQFYAFGRPERSFSSEIKKLFADFSLPWRDDLWINNRFVSIGYYALVHLPETRPVAGMFARNVKWFGVDALPALLLDHQEIILKAKTEFQKDLKTYPVAYHLLPAKFTMPELHRVFETVMEKQMDRSRFQKKMFEYDVFQRLEERREGVPHRRPYLYMHKN